MNDNRANKAYSIQVYAVVSEKAPESLLEVFSNLESAEDMERQLTECFGGKFLIKRTYLYLDTNFYLTLSAMVE